MPILTFFQSSCQRVLLAQVSTTTRGFQLSLAQVSSYVARQETNPRESCLLSFFQWLKCQGMLLKSKQILVNPVSCFFQSSPLAIELRYEALLLESNRKQTMEGRKLTLQKWKYQTFCKSGNTRDILQKWRKRASINPIRAIKDICARQVQTIV